MLRNPSTNQVYQHQRSGNTARCMQEALKTMSNLCNQYGLKLIDSDYPYLKTPYANPYEDNKKIIGDVLKISNSKKNEITASPPFWGTMMTLIFQK